MFISELRKGKPLTVPLTGTRPLRWKTSTTSKGGLRAATSMPGAPRSFTLNLCCLVEADLGELGMVEIRLPHLRKPRKSGSHGRSTSIGERKLGARIETVEGHEHRGDGGKNHPACLGAEQSAGQPVGAL